MPAHIKLTDSVWGSLSKIFIKTSDTAWSSVKNGFIKISDTVWATFFSAENIPASENRATISQATATNGIITLTGRNYHWTNFSSAAYYFESSIDNSNWTTIDSGTITNPSAGSSNTKTYQLQQSDMTANTTNYFRFTVTVTSSANAIGSSISNSTSVEMPRDINNLSYTDVQRNQITLSWTASTYAGRQMLYYKYTYDAYGNLSSDSIYELYGGYDGSTSSAIVTGLTANKSYSFRIRPWTGTSNNYGYYGNYSNVLAISTLQGPVPTITNLQATNVTDASATISWNSTDQIGWEIQVPNVANYIGSSGTSYNITGLSADTSYTVTVIIYADGGNTATASVSFTTQAAFITPTAPAPTVTWSGTRSDGLTGQQWDWNSITASGSGYVDGYQWYLSTTASDAGFLSNGFTTGTRLVTGSTATRYAKVRASIAGSDANSYFGDWSAYVGAATFTPPFFPPFFPPYFPSTYRLCTSLDLLDQVCSSTGCDLGGCGGGNFCSNPTVNRCR